MFFFFFPTVCDCLSEYMGTHCGMEGEKTTLVRLSLWYSTLPLVGTSLTEANSVALVLWNKINHKEHQEKSVSHWEAENITEWMSLLYFPNNSCVHKANGILATRGLLDERSIRSFQINNWTSFNQSTRQASRPDRLHKNPSGKSTHRFLKSSKTNPGTGIFFHD